jgi:ABC-type lipoprotein export system ATPase subunit
VHVPGWIRWFRWTSPYFYAFRTVLIDQFRGRTFACADTSAQCSSDAALRAFHVPVHQPIAPYFAALLVIPAVIVLLALTLLVYWHPGGLKHARRYGANDNSEGEKKEKETVPPIDAVRAPVDVCARGVRVMVVRRGLDSVGQQEKKQTHILNSVDADFPAGQVSVVMGPSGSGKSTFLRALAGRPQEAGGALTSLVTDGEITLSGNTPSRLRTCAFVEQEDEYHLPALTVRETLRYVALLKLPSTFTRAQKLARAEEVLGMLGLRDCADGLVGGELVKGISGGEKRRLSLACQMVSH